MFSMYDVLNIIHNPMFIENNTLWLLCYYKLSMYTPYISKHSMALYNPLKENISLFIEL